MSLAERDALLSCLLGQEWPHEPLLDALSLSPSADVLEVGAGHGRLLHFLSRRGHSGRLVGLDPQPGAGVQTRPEVLRIYPSRQLRLMSC